MLALLLVAASLGLSNFAAAIAIGVSGVDARIRLRVGIVFGLFEAGMPLLGLLLGHGLVRTLGPRSSSPARHSARTLSNG
jgi:putative Mn2+ efflux pump MntP